MWARRAVCGVIGEIKDEEGREVAWGCGWHGSGLLGVLGYRRGGKEGGQVHISERVKWSRIFLHWHAFGPRVPKV